MLADRTSISVPLTWGGERHAGLELQRPFGGDLDRAPVLRLSGGVAAYRRVNPYFDSADFRVEARVRGEHAFMPWLRTGVSARTARVDFGGLVDRHDAFGADVIVDTRQDPSFPRNAVYAELGREQLRFDASAAANRVSVGRWRTDVRGYVRAIGSSVIAVRAQFITSDAPLPASEQSLLGGSDTLRGYRAGAAAGDNLGALSLELRVPLTSPVSVGRFGVKGFVDPGTTWAAGTAMRDSRWQRGIGAGVFFGGGPVLIDAAVAWPREGGPRGHFGLGVTF
jgi:outer membrane protein assembly factor BamA